MYSYFISWEYMFETYDIKCTSSAVKMQVNLNVKDRKVFLYLIQIPLRASSLSEIILDLKRQNVFAGQWISCCSVNKLLLHLHLAAASPGSPGARRSSGRWWGPLCFSPGSLWTALSADGGWSSGPRRPAGRPYPGPRSRTAQPDAPPFEPSPEGRGVGGRQLERGGEGWVTGEVHTYHTYGESTWPKTACVHRIMSLLDLIPANYIINDLKTCEWKTWKGTTLWYYMNIHTKTLKIEIETSWTATDQL